MKTTLLEGTYAQALKAFLGKVQQVDSILSELTKDLIDVKGQIPYELSQFINDAISSLGTMHRTLSSARMSISKAITPQQPGGRRESLDLPVRAPLTEGKGEVENLAEVLVDLGYGRNMNAPGSEIWYAHPEGHQVSARPNGRTLSWRYYPPRMIGEMAKGLGLDKLTDHLEQIHKKRDRMTEAAKELETGYRDYLVQQLTVAPVEQYRIWEKGTSYPTMVSHDPKSGHWKCLSCAANTAQPEGPDVHVELVKRWGYLGKPPIKNTGPSGPDTATQAQVADGGYERPGFHKTQVPVGLKDLNIVRS